MSRVFFLNLSMGSKGKVKLGEQVAIEYFQSKGYTNIVHEPDGNIPPDLLINGSIAVEVRRLNQFKKMNGKHHPLENLEYSLMPRVRKLINDFANPDTSSTLTAFISIDYKRPLKVDQMLMEDIRSVLRAHLPFLNQHLQYQIRDNLTLRIRNSRKSYGRPYVWASQYDGDGGGAVVANILESLEIILAEKHEKIQPYRPKYETWWLAGNDKVGFGIDEIDLSQLEQAFNIKTFFERIIFISPFDSKEGVELIVPKHARI
jgi:hypothetical protein